VRTFRYVKLTIDTRDEALTINGFNNKFTAYPFEQKAGFSSNDSSLQKIWDVSWRTARLCALETYMDCPYYEQLQYIGDTRIQALISMYVTGDDRLARNAIRQLYSSMQSMGLTKSNHPSKDIQVIPPFSLLFICMIHDYYMMRDDPEFIREFIPGMKFILEWFVGRMDNTDMLGPLPFWNYVDASAPEFREGSPPGISEGHSAHMSVLLAYTIDLANQMFSHYGYQCDAVYYQKISEKLKSAVIRTCFDKRKGLIAETPEREIFSQHTNSFAILANMFDLQTAKKVGRKMIEDSTIAKVGLYYDFYVFQALHKVGMGQQLLKELDKWKFYIDKGFSTFPEGGLQSRSDCHAWSSHPMFDLLNIICGFEPAEPGFKSITIAPQVGALKEINCKFPHPLGECGFTFDMDSNGRRRFEISMPKGLTGIFIFDNKKYKITSGKSVYEF
jgi:hypothetical protein